jgi:hypothetical protein
MSQAKTPGVADHPVADVGRTSPAQGGIIIAVIAIALNGLFFFLSAQLTHDLDDGGLMRLRGAFGMFSGLVALSAIAAAFAPKLVGHVLGVVMGVLAFGAGVEAYQHQLPSALWAALLIFGALMPLLAIRSWKGHRAAWAFLTVICGTLGVCLLFGAPKIRGLLGIGLWNALIIPGVLATATAALGSLHARYKD